MFNDYEFDYEVEKFEEGEVYYSREPEECVYWGRGTKHAWAKWLMISCEAWFEHHSRGQVQPTSHFLLFQPD